MLVDDQKPEQLQLKERPKEKPEDKPPALSSRVAAWALNEIGEEIKNERASGDDVLRAIAQYQLSLAAHRIADKLGDIEAALIELSCTLDDS